MGRDGQDRVRHSRLSARRPGAVNLIAVSDRPGQRPPLIAVAHGSKDPRAAATIGELISQVRSRAATRDLAELDVRVAFLDHCPPSLPQALGALGGPGSVADAAECVVVPLLLTAAYHSKTDIPAQLAAGVPAGLAARCAGTLGPHPLLLTALERRLAEAGLGLTARDRRKTSVVLAAAGSSDPHANATVAALAARWQARGGWRRADIVSATLGAAPEVADVILDRYQEARRAAEVTRIAVGAELSVPIVARAQLSRT